jgi:catechol 2,3-dioxygenase-like lactoylglutathione lyase family enzyme
MILSDRESRFVLRRGLVHLAPEPEDDAWSSSAVDLRPGSTLLRWKSIEDIRALGVEARFRPGRPDFRFAQVVQQFTEHLHGLQLNVTGIVSSQSRKQLYGIEHIAVDTDDYAGTLAKLKANGVRILEEMPPNAACRRVCFLEAPDGAQVEVIEKV